jgi:molybdopterin converting factor subunit 1
LWIDKLTADGPFMRVRILFFGVLKDVTGKSADTLELPEGAKVGDLLKHFETAIPQTRDWLSSVAVAVNQQYTGVETQLNPNDEVALLPPVSGGTDEQMERRYASIVHAPIDTARVVDDIKRAEDGAVVVFEGVVRNQTRGRKTLYLDYEGYEEMAVQKMEELAAKALKQFQIRDVTLIHRLGHLEIGETSVLILVASAHRAAAFEACRWLIDTLKRTVPIWKKEYFEDGAVWADGEPFPADIVSSNFRGQGSP